MQAKSLIVYGSSRFLNTLYANDLNITNATVNNLTVTGTTNIAAGSATSASLQINNKGALYGYDSWLRINEQKQFSSGVYFGSNIVRTDGSFQIGSAGANILMNTSGATFKVPININGTTYKWTTDGNINANGITATNANINKGIFHNAVVEGTLYATHQEIDHVANLGGVFLVTPTVKCISSGSNKTLTSVTVTASSTTRTNYDGESITYNYSLQINDSAFSTASIGGNNWVQYGEVKVSGNINGTVLGTCDGFIQSINTSTHVLTVAIKYNGDQTLATPSDISTVEDLNVMLKTVYDSGQSKHYPVGIWMKSRDANGYSHISLYGGTSVDPTVRIGNLQGCPTINGQTPTGWGIFTNNGYFSGMIVSNSGKIGNFTISDALYSTAKAFGTTANNVYIGDDGISLGTTFKVTKAGELTATSGSIANWNISSNNLAIGTWGTDNSAMLCTGTTGSETIGGSSLINGWVFTAGSKFGVTKTGDLYCSALHANSGAIASSVTIGGKAQSEYLNDNIEIGGRNLAKGSGVTRTWTSANGSNYGDARICNDIPEGTTITISIQVDADDVVWGSTQYQRVGCEFSIPKTGGGTQYIGIWAGKDLSDGANIVKSFTGNFHGRVSKTFVLAGNIAASSNYAIYTYAQNFTSGTIKLSNIKFEIGNKSTDWTPAPEDVNTSISNAAKTATNYLTTISGTTGISVHDSGDTSNFVNMNSNGVFVYKGGTQRAQFADTTIIGKPYNINSTDNESHAELTPNAFKLIDKENNAYFFVSDLRDLETGIAEITSIFYGDGTTTRFNIIPSAIDTSYSINFSDTDYVVNSKDKYSFSLNTAPPVGTEITVVYRTDSDEAKAYTLGTRLNDNIGALSVAEGSETTASGGYSHAEGQLSIAYGSYSHAEGSSTTASGSASHSEGKSTMALGDQAHSEGYTSYANGRCAHAEGYFTLADGDYSHASGFNTQALRRSQTVIGEYNRLDTASSYRYFRGTYAFIIGNGESDSSRSDAMTVTWDGNVFLAVDELAESPYVDYELLQAITSLGWNNDVIID